MPDWYSGLTDWWRRTQPPPPEPIGPVSFPKSFQELKTNIGKSLGGLTPSEIAQNYGKKLVANAKKWWEDPEPSAVSKAMGALSESGGRATGAALDVVSDPRKSPSDIVYEGVKGLRSGAKKGATKATTPSQEIAKRGIDLYGQDPIAGAVTSLGLDAAIDPSNLIPGHAIASVLGKAGTLAKDAALPYNIWKKIRNVEGLAHETNQAGHAQKILDRGFRLHTDSDVLSRWGHASAYTPEQAAAHRAAGETVRGSHPSYSSTYGEHMPVSFPDEAMIMDAAPGAPIPEEDVQTVVDTLHPQLDKDMIDKIWEAYHKQSRWVIPHEDIRAGRISPETMKRIYEDRAQNPVARRDIEALAQLLVKRDYPGVAGRRGIIRGSETTPLNQPDATRKVAGVYHSDYNAGGNPPAMAFNPEFALFGPAGSQNDPLTIPWQPGTIFHEPGSSHTGVFPKDAPGGIPGPAGDQPPHPVKLAPVTPAPVPSPVAAPAPTPFPKLKQTPFAKAQPTESIETHVNDIKDILGSYGFNADRILQGGDFSSVSPETLHKDVAAVMSNIGAQDQNFRADEAAGEIMDLWEQKAKSMGPADQIPGAITDPNVDPQGVGIMIDLVNDPNSTNEQIWRHWTGELNGSEVAYIQKNHPEEYAHIKQIVEGVDQSKKTVAPPTSNMMSQANKTAENLATDYQVNVWDSPHFGMSDAVKHFHELPPEAQEAFKKKYPNDYQTLSTSYAWQKNPSTHLEPGKDFFVSPESSHWKNINTATGFAEALSKGGRYQDILGTYDKLGPEHKNYLKAVYPSHQKLVEAIQKTNAPIAPPTLNAPIKSTTGVKLTPEDWNTVDTFYSKLGASIDPNEDAAIAEFFNMKPELQEAYAKEYPDSYQKYFANALPPGPVPPVPTKSNLPPYSDLYIEDMINASNKYGGPQGSDYNVQNAWAYMTPHEQQYFAQNHPAEYDKIKHLIDTSEVTAPTPSMPSAPGPGESGTHFVETMAAVANKYSPQTHKPQDVIEVWNNLLHSEQLEFATKYPKEFEKIKDMVMPYSPTLFPKTPGVKTKGQKLSEISKLDPTAKKVYFNLLQLGITHDEAMKQVTAIKPSATQVVPTALENFVNDVPPPSKGIYGPGEVTTKTPSEFVMKDPYPELAGMHAKEIYTKNGQDYIFKPNHGPDFVPYMEHHAQKIANLAGLYSIDMSVEHMGGKTGTMQAVVGNNTKWPSLRSPGQSIEKLTKQQLKDIIKNHPVDWLTANHDAHRGQWLITPNGIIEIDRGQAFKHFGQDSLAKDYNPNAKFGEEPSIYIGIQKLFKEGKLPQLTENDIRQALEETITNLDAETVNVKDYLDDALDRAGKSQYKSEAYQRFMKLRQDLSAFWAK